MLIKDLYGEQMNEGRGAMLNRRAFSDVLPDPPRSSRRKEEARQVEFVRIVKGDAPTSLATTGLFKRAPWEPHCFYPDFSHEIVCGDSWGDSRLIVATEDGVFLVEGRDSKIHVFRLSDFDGELSGETTTRGRADLKEHRLERTRGCQMYVISRPGGSHLRMVSTWCQMYAISRPGGSHLRMVSTGCQMYAISRPGGSHLRMDGKHRVSDVCHQQTRRFSSQDGKHRVSDVCHQQTRRFSPQDGKHMVSDVRHQQTRRFSPQDGKHRVSDPSRGPVAPPAIVSAILVARAIEARLTDLTEISGSTILRLELCQASVVVDQKRPLRYRWTGRAQHGRD
uniref:Uncharacterized protein n=1 Tax=Timema douglasi TaxID=61478 RepID=A0A7R8VXZ5_TIMDO|nr:unnamed protein product [Timema douglasi]